METVFPNSKPKHKPRHLCMAMAQWANNRVSAWIDTQPDMLQAIYWNAECLHQIEKKTPGNTPFECQVDAVMAWVCRHTSGPSGETGRSSVQNVPKKNKAPL